VVFRKPPGAYGGFLPWKKRAIWKRIFPLKNVGFAGSGRGREWLVRIVLPVPRSWESVLHAVVLVNKIRVGEDIVRCAGKGFDIRGKTCELKG